MLFPQIFLTALIQTRDITKMEQCLKQTLGRESTSSNINSQKLKIQYQSSRGWRVAPQFVFQAKKLHDVTEVTAWPP